MKQRVTILIDEYDVRHEPHRVHDAFRTALSKLPPPPFNEQWGEGKILSVSHDATHPEGCPVVFEFESKIDPLARRKRRQNCKRRWWTGPSIPIGNAA